MFVSRTSCSPANFTKARRARRRPPRRSRSRATHQKENPNPCRRRGSATAPGEDQTSWPTAKEVLCVDQEPQHPRVQPLAIASARKSIVDRLHEQVHAGCVRIPLTEKLLLREELGSGLSQRASLKLQ